MPRSAQELSASIEGVAILRDPVRRALYLHVAGADHPVGRDEAAAAVGSQRSLAAFHLDKLVGEGLLEATYSRLSGRTGPGAGRPAKLYRRSLRQLDLSLPPREYELAARLLMRAVDGDDQRSPQERLRESAHELGVALGVQARAAAGADADPQALLERANALLARYGFEPYEVTGVIHLRNCPFQALAREQPQLVCGMNLALIEGVLAGLGSTRLLARLDPHADRCCVVLDCSVEERAAAATSLRPH